MNRPCAIALNWNSFAALIGDEEDHRLLEQAVVERPQELSREQGQEAARAQQMRNVLDQAWAARVIEEGDRIASFALCSKRYNDLVPERC